MTHDYNCKATVFLAVRDGQTVLEALDSEDWEGIYACSDHADTTHLRSDYRYEAVPQELVERVTKGQCDGCWQNWADDLRRYYEDEARAEWERAR